MRLFVIGGTGRTGKELIQQALEHGHQVTAFARSPEKIREKNALLSVVEGDIFDRDALARAMQGHDAVASMLGPVKAREPSTLMQTSAQCTVEAMRISGVERIAVLSSAAHFSGFLNSIARFILRNHMIDSLRMEQIVRESDLEWTIARPPGLTNGGRKTFRSREDAAPKLAFSLSRAAVAAFLLDSLEKRQHVRKIVGIAR